ncbi:hypothetical protein KCP75_19040 [Salmonella enterica subsp. enterica]|nr:hypothetical protein KCP75_19040 [Salmonella enterica subsp. enterica]
MTSLALVSCSSGGKRGPALRKNGRAEQYHAGAGSVVWSGCEVSPDGVGRSRRRN